MTSQRRLRCRVSVSLGLENCQPSLKCHRCACKLKIQCLLDSLGCGFWAEQPEQVSWDLRGIVVERTRAEAGAAAARMAYAAERAKLHSQATWALHTNLKVAVAKLRFFASGNREWGSRAFCLSTSV